MPQALGFLVLGVVAGVLSGLVGVGGGVFIIPVLVFVFGLTQQQAQGTTLALLVPPIGILAAWTYYQKGLVDLRIAGLICAGFVVGGLFGAKLAVGFSNETLRRVFGGFLVLVGFKMVLGK